MWCIIAFDLPTTTAAEQKKYRIFFTFLKSEGFCPIQKSIFFRWFEQKENILSCKTRMNSQILQGENNILILPIPQETFSNIIHVLNGKTHTMPSPPTPWNLF